MNIQKNFNRKRALLTALTEDILFLFFILCFFTSSIEVILPGSISTKIPVAVVFTLFALILVFYSFLLEKKFRNISDYTLPKITILTALTFFFLALFMNRSFGLTGSILQALILVFIVTLGYKNFSPFK